MFLSRVTFYLTITLILLLMLTVVGIVLFILINRRKTSISEVYYDSFERHDSLEYLKFDSIVSCPVDGPFKGMGVMVIDKNTFVSAISVTGYPFFRASYDTQVNTINAFISMMDSLEDPISLRQTVKAIDISHNIDEHKKLVDKFQKEIRDLDFQIQTLIDDAEDYLDENPELSAEYVDRAETLRAISKLVEIVVGILQDISPETREMIDYMTSISVDSGDTKKVQNIIFSYTYDGSQFTTQLSQEEIYMEAFTKLTSKASNLISSIYRTGGSAKVETAEGLSDLFYRHMHPVTSDEVSIKELLESDLDSLFVTSDSLLDIIREKLTSEQLEEMMNVLQQELAEKEKRQRLMSERAEMDRVEAITEIAKSQISPSTE